MANQRLGGFLGLDDFPDGAEIRGVASQHLSIQEQQTEYLRKIAVGSPENPDYFEMTDAVAATGAGDFTVTSRIIPQGKRFIVYRIAVIAPGSTFAYAKMYTSPTGGAADSGSFRATVNDASNSKSYESPFGIVVHGGQAITTVFSVSGATACNVRYEGELFTEPVRQSPASN